MPSGVVELKLSAIAAVFFDFGETLATLSPSREEIFTEVASSMGLGLDIESVRRAYHIVDFHHKYSSVHVNDHDAFYRHYNEQLCEALGISSHAAQLAPALATRFRQDKNWKLFEDVPTALDRLSALGISMALVANWDSKLSSLVERLGIRKFFSTIVASQEAGVEKPNPAIFRLALERLSLSVSTQTILYVGNEYRADVLGARTAGLTPVLIDRSSSYPNADCLRFSSLLKWLETIV